MGGIYDIRTNQYADRKAIIDDHWIFMDFQILSQKKTCWNNLFKIALTGLLALAAAIVWQCAHLVWATGARRENGQRWGWGVEVALAHFRHISPLHCLRMQMHDFGWFLGVTWSFVVLCWKIGVTWPLGVVWHRGGVRALISVADVVRWCEIRMPVSNFPITEWGDWWWMAWHVKRL